MIRGAAVGAALLLGVSACASEERGGAVTPPSRDELQLAVSRSVAGNPPRRDIVLLTAGGKVVRELVSGAAFSPAGGAAWSPDGRRFAFAATVGKPTFEGAERTDIYMAELGASKPRRLTASGRAFAPVWAPDGRSIVFAELIFRAFPQTATISSLELETGRRRQLLDAERLRVDTPTSFSPDGSQLAFTRLTGFEVDEEARIANTAAIYLLDMRSLEARKLVDRAADAAFSPDGRRLAYVTDRDENGELSYGDFVRYANELYVMDLETREETRVTETRDLNERAPSWSPDGELIAYVRGEVIDNAEGSVVMTARPDGTCPRRIAFNPGLDVWYTSPVWRPRLPRSDAHLECRPDPEPQPVPLAGNMTLAEARAFRDFDLYWLGPRFDEFFLSSISRQPWSGPRGRGTTVLLHYGDVQLQLNHACVSVPADIDLPPDGRTRIRGVDAFFYEGGSALELVTGETTIRIFGSDSRQVLEVARALRPIAVTAPPRPEDALPPPAPGALEQKLRC